MAQQPIADVANPIADFAPVTMLARQEDHAGGQRKLSSSVELRDIPTETSGAAMPDRPLLRMQRDTCRQPHPVQRLGRIAGQHPQWQERRKGRPAPWP